MSGFPLDIFEENFPCRIHRQSGNALQFRQLLVMQCGDISLCLFYAVLTLGQLLFALLQAFHLFIQRFLALKQTAFRALQLRPAFAVFPLGFGTGLDGLFLGLQNHFLFDVGCLDPGLLIQLFYRVFRLGYLCFGHIFAVSVTDQQADGQNQDPTGEIHPPFHAPKSPVS